MRTRHVASLAAMLVIAAGVSAFAEEMPLAGSTRPQQTPPAGNASQDSPERDGAFITAGLGFGQQTHVAADLQLGWMFAPWIGAFASLGGLMAEYSVTSMRGIGVRLARGPVFAEGQIASLTVHPDCESDAPCPHRTLHVGIVGAGLEVIHLRHFALDLRLQVVTDRHDVFTGFGLGIFF